MPRRAAQPPQQRNLDDVDLYLDKDELPIFDFEDPFHEFYTETQYWRSPNDAIKRRINNLDMTMFSSGVAIKALANYEIPIINTVEMDDISLEALGDGQYQAGRSNSDEMAADRIKGILNKLPSFAQYKDQDDLSWIVKKHRLLILEMFEYITENRKSRSMAESELYAIMRVVENALEDRHVLYLKINAIYKLVRADIRHEEGNNKLNEYELAKGGLIPWQTVLDKQAELERNFAALSNTQKKTPSGYKLNQNLVLLSLYCLIPPLRGEIRTLQFADNPAGGYLDRHEAGSGDLVLIENNTYSLELHKLKKRHGFIRFDLPANLQNILRESYTLYKRKHVFTKDYKNLNTTIKPSSVSLRLKNLFSGYVVGSSMLRSSYTTYMYSKRPRINFNTKKEMARRMRTSIMMLESNYFKILDDINEAPQAQQPVVERKIATRVRGVPRGDDEEDDDMEDPEKDCIILVNRKTKTTNNAYENHKKSQREYYKKNREKILEKNKNYRQANPEKESRRKVIYMLNHSETYRNKIGKDTLTKHNIRRMDGRYI